MRGTDIVRSQHAPLRIEPRFGKVAEDAAEHASSGSIAACEETGYVLEEPEGSVTFSQYAKGVRPEVSGVQSAEAVAGLGVRLAGEATGDDIARSGDGAEVPHVQVAGYVGEAGGEHSLAIGVVLDELHGLPSEDKAAEQAAAGSGEEGKFSHGSPSSMHQSWRTDVGTEDRYSIAAMMSLTRSIVCGSTCEYVDCSTRDEL